MTVLLANTSNITAQPVYIVDGQTAQPVSFTGGGSTGNSASTGVAATPSTSSTATKTNVTASTTQVILLVANANRKGASIRNTDTSVLYIDVLDGVSANSHMQQIDSGGYYEFPFSWVGAIYGRWAGSNGGAALVREFTS